MLNGRDRFPGLSIVDVLGGSVEVRSSVGGDSEIAASIPGAGLPAAELNVVSQTSGVNVLKEGT